MMMEVLITHEGVDDEEPPSSAWIEKVVQESLRAAEFEHDCEVSVLITGDEKIQELNRSYRGIDKTTDVLSFALEEDDSIALPPGAPRVLGDVALSLPQVKRQAKEHQVTPSRECGWALCHGVLHLIGYDHMTDEQEAEMRALESRTLDGLGEGFFDW